MSMTALLKALAVSTEYEIPEWLAELLEGEDEEPLGISKGAAHKYIRREPTGNPKRPWRYFYKVQHGGGAGGAFDVKEGAAFRIKHGDKEGHFHVLKVEGDEVTIRHDESGHEGKVPAAALRAMFAKEHAGAIESHRDKLKRELAAAEKAGTPKQRERLAKEAEKAGVKEEPKQETLAEYKRRRAEAAKPDPEEVGRDAYHKDVPRHTLSPKERAGWDDEHHPGSVSMEHASVKDLGHGRYEIIIHASDDPVSPTQAKFIISSKDHPDIMAQEVKNALYATGGTPNAKNAVREAFREADVGFSGDEIIERTSAKSRFRWTQGAKALSDTLASFHARAGEVERVLSALGLNNPGVDLNPIKTAIRSFSHTPTDTAGDHIKDEIDTAVDKVRALAKKGATPPSNPWAEQGVTLKPQTERKYLGEGLVHVPNGSIDILDADGEKITTFKRQDIEGGGMIRHLSGVVEKHIQAKEKAKKESAEEAEVKSKRSTEKWKKPSEKDFIRDRDGNAVATEYLGKTSNIAIAQSGVKGTWLVHHSPTGKTLGPRFKTKKKAKEYAEILHGHAGDFPREEDGFPPEQLRAAQKVKDWAYREANRD
jgi:hypothetical protein